MCYPNSWLFSAASPHCRMSANRIGASLLVWCLRDYLLALSSAPQTVSMLLVYFSSSSTLEPPYKLHPRSQVTSIKNLQVKHSVSFRLIKFQVQRCCSSTGTSVGYLGSQQGRIPRELTALLLCRRLSKRCGWCVWAFWACKQPKRAIWPRMDTTSDGSALAAPGTGILMAKALAVRFQLRICSAIPCPN